MRPYPGRRVSGSTAGENKSGGPETRFSAGGRTGASDIRRRRPREFAGGPAVQAPRRAGGGPVLAPERDSSPKPELSGYHAGDHDLAGPAVCRGSCVQLLRELYASILTQKPCARADRASTRPLGEKPGERVYPVRADQQVGFVKPDPGHAVVVHGPARR